MEAHRKDVSGFPSSVVCYGVNLSVENIFQEGGFQGTETFHALELPGIAMIFTGAPEVSGSEGRRRGRDPESFIGILIWKW